MPDMFQQMIGNGFDNINVVPKLANNLLQWNLKGFAVELGRFLINTTLGIGGLFDIAKQEFGLEKTQVDFGQTLGKWGVGPGPYLIVPVPGAAHRARRHRLRRGRRHGSADATSCPSSGTGSR